MKKSSASVSTFMKDGYIFHVSTESLHQLCIQHYAHSNSNISVIKNNMAFSSLIILNFFQLPFNLLIQRWPIGGLQAGLNPFSNFYLGHNLIYELRYGLKNLAQFSFYGKETESACFSHNLLLLYCHLIFMLSSQRDHGVFLV